MRRLLILLLYIVSTTSTIAQDTTKIEIPKIISKLKIEHSLDFDSKSIKFVRVLEDSRCPTGVSCMWQGEVKILIEISENKKVIEEKELVFDSKSPSPDKAIQLLVTDEKTIYAFNVSPYPTSEGPIMKTAYFLELIVK